MKSIITSLFIAFFISNTYAHKEPIKTLKDKKEVDNTPLLHVENTFNNEGKRIRKKLFSADNDVLFYFEYKYFKNTNKYSNIVKKLSNDKVFTQTIYKLNAQGFTESTTVIDEDGKIISFSSYIYSNY